jgi:hypothetical protein
MLDRSSGARSTSALLNVYKIADALDVRMSALFVD